MTAPDAAWARYRAAARYLDDELIRPAPPELPASPTRRAWMEAFLDELGHPERGLPTIHVAATSGKGSVATMIAEVLRASGRRVGLHTSPYLQVATEKLWVDGRYATAEELHSLAEWIRPVATRWKRPEVPLHALASTACVLEHFRRRRVELAVIEAGVGGRDDVTNVVETLVAVVGSVGLDHQRVLGETVEAIAEHKAGIIRESCRAVVLDGAAVVPARRRAHEVSAALRVVRPDEARTTAPAEDELDGDGATLAFRGRRFRLDALRLGLRGAFQAQNAALALAALEELDLDGASIDEAAVRAGLAAARLPGRAELLPRGGPSPCPVLLDGAHNADKLRALESLLRAASSRRVHLVVGVLAGRALEEALRSLAARATTVVATEPRVFGKPAHPAQELARALGSGARAIADPTEAFAAAAAGAAPSDLLVVTGSLYLVGELRGLWYRPEQVLAERASWY
ncbi:MAG: bifunctional folylpolyglutamate synthase/dihydrofolate synthase [Deltaproteobacteria bacterium]|nr:bifunctional folylpolyglutamate synthase/dihydrofolate synthase [Deltaproteobacteria bacterium]